jgi:lipopolysaccharide assembly protein A
MKVQWIILAALLFALITGVFAVINVDPVLVDFLFVQTQTPLILVILASALLGGLMVGLFGIVRQYRMQRRIKTLEKQLALATPPDEAGGTIVTVFDDKTGTVRSTASDNDGNSRDAAAADDAPPHRLH